jgi:hypothetical protein
MRPRRGDHGQTDERDRQRAEADVGGPQWHLLSGATYGVAGAMIASTFSNRRGTACGTSAGIRRPRPLLAIAMTVLLVVAIPTA